MGLSDDVPLAPLTKTVFFSFRIGGVPMATGWSTSAPTANGRPKRQTHFYHLSCVSRFVFKYLYSDIYQRIVVVLRARPSGVSPLF